MEAPLPADAKTFRYHFDQTINRSRGDVWKLIVEDVNAWWLADFRVLGADSTMTLNPAVGGGLVETSGGGGFLEWYRVQMCTPGEVLYLTGYLAPDWGGPTVSMLKLELTETSETSTTLRVSEGLMGNVTSKSVAQAREGWELLIGTGLVGIAG